jgi:membrane protein
MSRKVSILGAFIAFIAVNNIIAFSFNLGAPYYVIMGGSLLFALLQSKVLSFDVPMLLLYLACALSIIGNPVPAFFQPWGRLVSFTLVTMLISPFIKSEFLYRFRVVTFKMVQWLLQPVVLGSLLVYFLGISFGRRDFAGITTQSMLIAPVSANVIITGIYFLTRKKTLKRNYRIYLIVLVIAAFITLLLAASRTAIIAAVVSLLFYFYVVNKANLIKFLKYIFLLAIVMAATYSLWSPYLENVIRKNEGSIAAGGIASSREEHWNTRLLEFKSSPCIGIGFASVSIQSRDGATFDQDSGRVETGSSWLSVLSMTGIFGFGAFMGLFVRAFGQLKKVGRNDLCHASYLSALLIFWCFHMMAEGYIFGAGGFLFFSVWLLLGCIDALGRNKNLIMAGNNIHI